MLDGRQAVQVWNRHAEDLWGLRSDEAVDNHFLDPNYTVFAHVTAGMSVVTAINNVATGQGDVPVDPVIVNSVTVK